MSYRSIALIGKARSGKDSTCAALVGGYAFTRLALADPLKEMALRMDPLIPTGHGVHVRLSKLIEDVGWEYAKTHYPEVRRFLQHTGQTIRENDPYYWVRILMDKVDSAEKWNMPVVVTDVRYRNEAEALRLRGFLMVRVQRPDLVSTDTHDSENELNDYPTDETLINDGSLVDLRSNAYTLVRKR